MLNKYYTKEAVWFNDRVPVLSGSTVYLRNM